MISFTLACSAGHSFDGWLSSSDSFEQQRDGGDVTCPVCGTASVDKALMAPAIATSRRREGMRVAAHIGDGDVVAMMRKLRKHLTENAENVGERFPEEARRIHYDEAEKRAIYGEASAEEVRSLLDEGIEFHPLPALPEDQN